MGTVDDVVITGITPSDCGSVVFQAKGGGGGSAVGSFGDEGALTTERVLVPGFVGLVHATAVAPGHYQFALSCSDGPGMAGFRTVTASFDVTSPAYPPGRFVGMARTPDGEGYWLSQAGGGVYSFGDAHFYGSLPGLGVVPHAPIVGIEPTPDGKGYWLVGADGGVFAFGDARFHGSLPALDITPAAPIVGMVASADGNGYWLVGADAGIDALDGQFAFGDAPYCGPPGIHVDGPLFPPGWVTGLPTAVGISSNAGSVGAEGFDEVATDGSGTILPAPERTCAQPRSQFGSFGLSPIRAEISAIAAADSVGGAWLVGIDGGVFAVQGDGLLPPPPFYGSLPSMGVSPTAPIIGITATADDRGYWLLGADGGVFTFGDARFYGSAAP
ncbi:MAG TPA: hypothetical protein VMB82_11665 [Acidimicrobiales bacterium]|nr:hypothetical protein [Acidimicrobiales bacterium]